MLASSLVKIRVCLPCPEESAAWQDTRGALAPLLCQTVGDALDATCRPDELRFVGSSVEVLPEYFNALAHKRLVERRCFLWLRALHRARDTCGSMETGSGSGLGLGSGGVRGRVGVGVGGSGSVRWVGVGDRARDEDKDGVLGAGNITCLDAPLHLLAHLRLKLLCTKESTPTDLHRICI